MSGEPDPVGAAPEVRKARFLWLLFSCSATPLLWLGQVMLSYGITSRACYPGDHPVAPVSASPLLTGLGLMTALALTGCGAATLVAWREWRMRRTGRNHFLAVWGLMSSLWFFTAILFNLIAALAVPICPG